MKVLIIGSTQYKERMEAHAAELLGQGHEVMLPAFDDHEELDALGVCQHNRALMERATEVHVIWDQRSFGTIFDLGMAFALRKKLRVIFLEPKTFAGVMRKWEEEVRGMIPGRFVPDDDTAGQLGAAMADAVGFEMEERHRLEKRVEELEKKVKKKKRKNGPVSS